MTQTFRLNYTNLSAFLPPGLPKVWDLTVGLPEPKRILSMMAAGSQGAQDTRLFILHHMIAACRRIEALEHQPSESADTLKDALDRAAYNELTALTDTWADMLDTVSVAKGGQSTTERLQTLISSHLEACAHVGGCEEAERLASIRAKTYYTAWKSLERQVAKKSEPLKDTEEHTLSLVLAELAEKGYLAELAGKGRLGSGEVLEAILNVAKSLPGATSCDVVTTIESVMAPGDPCPVESVMAVGDPYPVEFRVKDVAEGVTRSYRRADRPAVDAIPPADVSSYQELERINTLLMQRNADLEAQLKVVPAASPMGTLGDTTYQILKRELSGDGTLTLAVRVARVDGHTQDHVLVDYTELRQACKERDALGLELETLRPLAEERKNEIFFRTGEGTSYGCDNMSINPEGEISSLALRVRMPDGTEKRQAFAPMAKVDELVGLLENQRVRIADLETPKHQRDVLQLANGDTLHCCSWMGSGPVGEVQCYRRMSFHSCLTGGIVEFMTREEFESTSCPPPAEPEGPRKGTDVAEGMLKDLIAEVLNGGDCPAEGCNVTLEPGGGPRSTAHWDNFAWRVVTVPRDVNCSASSDNPMDGSAYDISTNVLCAIVAWRGEHPSTWKAESIKL